MNRLHTEMEMVAWSGAVRRQGLTIGFVPTMGFLHQGHRSLMALLRPRVDRLVVSIYVNPLQFGPEEDLDHYPRDTEGDLAKCRAEGVDAVFLPETLYAEGFQTTVSVAGITTGLCGDSRPGHFDGVTTVVARLFGLTRCDVAAFGEKDYQQLQVISRMVEDLALAVEVVAGPIVRDSDGLALSSRNAYLSADQRRRGLSLSAALRAISEAVDAGQRDVSKLLTLGRQVLDVDVEDYLELVDARTLAPLTTIDRPARGLVAAFMGNTRLIDNLALGSMWT